MVESATDKLACGLQKCNGFGISKFVLDLEKIVDACDENSVRSDFAGGHFYIEFVDVMIKGIPVTHICNGVSECETLDFSHRFGEAYFGIDEALCEISDFVVSLDV